MKGAEKVSSRKKMKRDKNSELLVIEVPKVAPRRYKWVDDRVVLIDLRGIRKPFTGSANGDVRRKFNSPEHLEALCNEYFASCDGVLYNHKTGRPYLDKDGFPVVGQIKPYTVSGLALFLDISTENLKRYEKGIMDSIGFEESDKLEYSRVVRRARQRIEAYAEYRLYDRDGYNGARFVLDNAFNWISQREQAEIEHLRKTDTLKHKEYKLKKDTLVGANEDEPITITITRASKENEDD